MANLITFSRIILSFVMLLIPACSPEFYSCYLLAGFSDMIDGAVARRYETTSDSGAGLDTAADMVFAAVSVYKFLPILNLPVSIWIWTGVIAAVKIVNIISGYIIKKQFVPVHSAANRLTGFLLFTLPLSATIVDLRYSSAIVCAAAAFAAIQEGHFIRAGR